MQELKEAQTEPEKTNVVPFLKILEEFEKLIIPLEKEEFEQLEKQILEHGVREPLVTWNGYLVDGHHRYKICCRHGLKFPQVEYVFSCKEAVKSFIYKNQCGRRNIQLFQKIEYAKAACEIDLKLEAKERQIRKPVEKNSVPHNCGEQIKKRENETDRKMANLTGTSHQTIHKASKITDFATEETKQKLREGKKSIDAAYRELKAENAMCKDRFPKQKYRVFYGDFYKKDCIDGWEPIENFADLKIIPVRDFHDDRAVCFLWTPVESLYSTQLVMSAWGFSYRTCFTLENDRKFEGLYNSCDHLMVLVGVGKYGCVPDTEDRISSVLDRNMAGERRVSKFRNIIDQMYHTGNKIEFFSDNKTADWDVYR